MISVGYFAELSAVAGMELEQIAHSGDTLRQIYLALQQRHGFRFTELLLKPVCNDVLVAWDVVPADGDTIAFLPPFSGG